MPKKHQKTPYSKPASTAHHTLISSPRHDQNDRFRSSPASSSTEQPSVNALIDHLRRTQVSGSPSDHAARSSARPFAPRSVHPSLRNVLELPETPPPRPRPGNRRVGVGGRVRRVAGPPAPESWLTGSNGEDDNNESEFDPHAAETERVIYRLERLPGTTYPRKDALLHIVLKSMASHWLWHVEYDGQFLGMLPTHVKTLLLSYISIYAKDQSIGQIMQGLRPLFEKSRPEDGVGDSDAHDVDSEVTRLDLSNAMGRWMSFKQLSRELLVSKTASANRDKAKAPIPTSWEDEYEEDSSAPSATSLTMTIGRGLRFENLRFLSLAHPKPNAANWNSLIALLSHLSTITHLSLAHWPVPTLTPNATNARIRHPTQRSLTFSFSGTDTYAASENNWAEAAGILRRLSRASYCLKWLDLEGCSDWIPALNWDGVGPDGEFYAAGPEWNGSWRDIEFVRLGPGWLPHVDDSELLPPSSGTESGARGGSSVATAAASASSPLRSLATSIHAPSPSRAVPMEVPSTDETDLPWDVEVERIKYRRQKEIEQFRQAVHDAKSVQRRVLRVRREGRGKWAQFSFGLEGLDDGVLKKLLGLDYLRRLP